MILKKFILFLVCFLFSQLIYAGHYEDRLNLEKSYTSKIQTILDGLYGPGNFIARTNIDLGPESWTVKYTEQAKAKRAKNTKKTDEAYILPGYRVIKNLADDLDQLPFNSNVIKNPAKIKKITIDLIVNKSFSKTESRRASDYIFKSIGLDRKRGDTINLERKTLYSGLGVTQNMVTHAGNEKLLSFQNLFNIVLILLFIIFIIIYLITQSKSSDSEGGLGGGSTSVSVNPNLELPEGSSDSAELSLTNEPSIKRYFNFIKESNLDNLLYIINQNKFSIEDISMILAFLPSKISASLIAKLSIKEQSVLSINLLNRQMVNRSYVEKLETTIKDGLECLVGGKVSFESVFNYISNETKKSLLTALGKSNPNGYKLFRENIVIFDDLKNLSNDEIKLILSEVSMDVLSIALIASDKSSYAKFEKNMTQSSRDMIQQFLSLKSSSISPQQIEQAQSQIISIVNRFESEGKLDLRGKIKLK